MAGKKRSRSKKKSQSRSSRFISLLHGILTTIILVGAGILIGSFWGQWRTVLPEDATFESVERPLSERIKVEVLNGVGEQGLAQRVSRGFRDLGFDVVAIGNADELERGETRVLDRSGRDGAAREVAQKLGLDSISVALDPELFLDVTVIVGQNWRETLDVLGRE